MIQAKSLKHALHFFKAFLTRPHHVGSVFPSSRFLAQEMVRGLTLQNHESLVELGPGTGPLTKYIAGLLTTPDAFLAIDRELSFIKLLKGQYPDLNFVHGEAQNMRALCQKHLQHPVKIVISALPFALFDESLQESILQELVAVSSVGTVFRTFQYAHTFLTPNAKRLRRRVSQLFDDPGTKSLVVRNFPPAYVLSWVKKSA